MELAPRVEALERQYQDLKASLQRVELEQTHARETMNLRFETLTRGQDLVVAKLEAMQAGLQQSMSEPDRSPVGRALMTELSHVRSIATAQAVRLDELEEKANKLDGALTFAKNIGVSSILLALASLGVALVKIYGGHP